MKELKPGARPIALVKGAGIQLYPRVSPDVRHVAYVSDEGGASEIYLRRFPSGEGRWQVSTTGGYWPRWSPRGDRLYYVNGNSIMDVETDLEGASPKLGSPSEALRRPSLGRTLVFNWPPGFDVTADGQRFLLNLPVGSDMPFHAYHLVQNWVQEFRAAK